MVRISSFKFGNITIDSKSYDHDVIVTWEGKVKPAGFAARHLFGKEEFMELLFERPEVIVVGLGTEPFAKVAPEVLEFAEQKDIRIIDKPTSLAVDEFNELAAEGKHVVAFMHITC